MGVQHHYFQHGKLAFRQYRLSGLVLRCQIGKSFLSARDLRAGAFGVVHPAASTNPLSTHRSLSPVGFFFANRDIAQHVGNHKTLTLKKKSPKTQRSTHTRNHAQTRTPHPHRPPRTTITHKHAHEVTRSRANNRNKQNVSPRGTGKRAFLRQ